MITWMNWFWNSIASLASSKVDSVGMLASRTARIISQVLVELSSYPSSLLYPLMNPYVIFMRIYYVSTLAG
jgi:hypothetical protein